MERSMPYGVPEIRDAVESDLSRILEITNHAIVHTTAVWTIAPTTLDARLRWFRDRASHGFPVLVAERAGVVFGFASYGEFRPWEGYRHTVEHSVYVHPEAQGRGLGRKLLTALLAHAARQGFHVMIGGIEARNAASVALHKWADFEEAGVLREVGCKFDRWLDLLFMRKQLSERAPT
jgi:L-amino acid N-acyltransferase YncA